MAQLLVGHEPARHVRADGEIPQHKHPEKE